MDQFSGSIENFENAQRARLNRAELCHEALRSGA
jgi:hypothetical protein